MTETMDLCLPPSKEAKQNKTKMLWNLFFKIK